MLPSARFQELARLEPRLIALWNACVGIERPAPVDPDDPFDVDPYAEEAPEDDWCAEDHFFRFIKPQLLSLIGWQRRDEPVELQSSEAYEVAFAALFHTALRRTCACCAMHQQSAA